ncbi:lipoprotein, putative [Pseudooceanicola batsensis HTCC2597]|uniref:Lipoprotein, putative n=1 Tax=Pseudooceanicola batsensis (strain ATCC BAA-863 / DSM 15984 / KCTC 12145 / HTCC2597) TaxID=252305 RepID=A3U1M1_PSEBH|nr:hypothetical protein [Pseudooceanicola batsensis]EAQ01802.1 lipoprotein, putative [Pseudooceanicola batsensis HTCC2597]
MKKTLFLLPIAGLLAACAMPPRDVPADAVSAYDEAVASVGCTLRSEKDYLPVEIQTGMTREQVLEMTAFKLATDKAEKLEDGSVKLTTGACA